MLASSVHFIYTELANPKLGIRLSNVLDVVNSRAHTHTHTR